MILQKGSPQEVGVSEVRVESIRRRAASWIEEGIHPALVILAARKGKIFLQQAYGRLGPEAQAEALKLDSLFPLTSITKPITATAVMILVEEGLLGLNRPVADYIPEFGGEGKEQVLVRQLLTHTSGLNQARLIEFTEKETGEFDQDTFPQWWSENVERYFKFIYQVPLWKPPDTVMSYADANYDLLGEIVGRVAGMDLGEFAEESIFKPLGMKDSYYKLPEELHDRVVIRSEDAIFYDLTTRFSQASLGSLAAFSTAKDMAIFAQMFLNGGFYGDAHILSQASVEAMTRNQIPGIGADLEDDFLPEAEWGLGWGVHRTKKLWAWDELLQSQCSYSHSGSGGVMLKVDPAYDLVMVFFSVYLEMLESGRPHANTDLFVNALYGSIVEL